MKKIVHLLLVVCLLIVASVPVASANNVRPENPFLFDQSISNFLNENNIQFQIEAGNIKLVDISPENIEHVNRLLKNKHREKLGSASTTYPTPYQHMILHDITYSKKFTAATKTAFVAAFTAWAKNVFSPWQEIVAVGIGGYAVYYFINSETEDLYTFIKYYYRSLGPGFFDMNGNFIGDYEIKKEIRVTKNSNATGGNVTTDERESSSIEPWF